MTAYYILFDNHEQAVRLHGQLRMGGLGSVIAPTPRSVSVCCGVSLMISEEEIGAVRTFLSHHACVYRSVERVEQEFNPRRDAYC
ncbi:MAG: DUF3343 domain-containing protein [Oscillibacter sp.]|jgi:hypothetical protein|nr:DUF3343 domain-containing protein [Oscillibacter sp.]